MVEPGSITLKIGIANQSINKKPKDFLSFLLKNTANKPKIRKIRVKGGVVNNIQSKGKVLKPKIKKFSGW